jgi:general secretion pathway protein B
MSYILDALKKLENEKGKKKPVAGMVCISGELFKDEQRRKTGGGVWKLVIVVVVASLVTFGATWYFLKGRNGHRFVKSRLAAQSMAVGDASSRRLSGVTTFPAASSAPSQAATVAPSVQHSASQTTTSVNPVVKETAPAIIVQKHGRSRTERKKPVTPAQPLEKPVARTTPPPADIKISGIAWQDEHSSRQAVVNGFLMHEGGIISGARITDILKDRVRFSQDGRIFEVPFVASAGLPELGK